MKINLINRKCQICEKSFDAFPELIPDIDPIVNKEDIIKFWTGFSKFNVFFPYFRCKCGFLYNKLFPDNESLINLYSNQKDNIISGDYNLDIKTKKYYLTQLKKFLLKKNIKILEIGADNGNFLKLIKNINNDCELYAIEPNLNMIKNINLVANKTYNNIYEINDKIKFDLIIGIHVFDHIPNLNSYFNKLNNLLKKNGVIYGVVHNEGSLLAKIFKKRWPALRLQHPHLFNNTTLNNFFIKFNFEKVYIKRTKNFFNFGFLFNQLVLKIFRFKISFPNLFSVGLKLGNFSFLYKKKN
jgi:SAM-dependent methyltransferase